MVFVMEPYGKIEETIASVTIIFAWYYRPILAIIEK